MLERKRSHVRSPVAEVVFLTETDYKNFRVYEIPGPVPVHSTDDVLKQRRAARYTF